MLILEVQVNGKVLARGGVIGNGSVAAEVRRCLRHGQRKPRLQVELHGYDADAKPMEHLEWAKAVVQAGDEVLIRILDGTSAEQPKRRQTQFTIEAPTPQRLRQELRISERRVVELRRKLEKLEARRATRAPSGHGKAPRSRKKQPA